MRVRFGMMAAVVAGSMMAMSGNAFSLSAEAVLVNAQGETVGKASFKQKKQEVHAKIKLQGISEGSHGVHIHAVGKCEGPDFVSAGPHFNPDAKEHGLHNPKGSHAGDLPNLIANKKGRVNTKIVISGVTLQSEQSNSLIRPEGTSLVIHAAADDEKTDPSGNSGARIVCGIIK